MAASARSACRENRASAAGWPTGTTELYLRTPNRGSAATYGTRREPVKIKLTSVYVDDQQKALRFYTDVLGFVKKADFTQAPFR